VSRRPRSDVLDDWATLRQDGYTIPDAAQRLGMTVEALSKALQRARRDGDERARFTWAGVKAARRGEAA
jgi:hypothetical protein